MPISISGHSGDAILVELPQIGIKGNTYALMADKNNLEIAQHLQDWLAQKGLDSKKVPQYGPKLLGLSTPSIPLQTQGK